MKIISQHHEDSLPLIVILGPTASGKTKIALEIAAKFNCEIICADSRTIYRGLDIGTAKPSCSDQLAIKHWMLDICSPDEYYSAYQFQYQVTSIIDEIRSRNKIPLMVGGTGLYIDAVLYDYKFPKTSRKPGPLMEMDINYIIDIMVKENNILPKNVKNKQHLINYYRRSGDSGFKNQQIRGDSIVVGIATDRTLLKERIVLRTDEMLRRGVVEEASLASEQFGWGAPGLSANIYKLIRRYLDNEIDYDLLRTLIVRKDNDLAKRQMTWFNRNKQINWYSLDKVFDHIKSRLD